MGIESDIKKAVKEKRIVIGTNSVLRSMKNGKVSSVVHASNVPESMKKDILSYSALSGISVKEFKGNSLQLGEICGKPFGILVVGLAAQK